MQVFFFPIHLESTTAWMSGSKVNSTVDDGKKTGSLAMRIDQKANTINSFGASEEGMRRVTSK